LHGFDDDSNETLSYALVSGEGDVDNGAFTIEGNELKLNTDSNFESKSSYSIRISVTDKDGLTFEKAVTISVNDLNEAPTQIFLSNTNIAENSPQDTEIGTLTSDDPDPNDTVTYTLTNDAEGKFKIVGDRLLVNSQLDYETATSHNVEVKVTDAVGLSATVPMTIEVQNDVKDDKPTLETTLASDTGSSDTDKITNNATIKGKINSANTITSFKVSLDDTVADKYVDFASKLQTDKSFTLDTATLKELNGNIDLVDGKHTIKMIAVDEFGNSTEEFSYSFTLDSTAPTLDILTPAADGEHSTTARAIGDVIDANKGENVEVTLDDGTPVSVSVNNKGHFDRQLLETGLTEGNHTAKIAATDLAGNTFSQSLGFSVTPDKFVLGGANTKGWGAKGTDKVLLGEQDSFVTQTDLPVELGQTEGARTLKFDLETWFDKTDKSTKLEDQLLVYLVDPANPTQTLLDSGIDGGALFALAGEKAEFRAGLVRFDGKSVEIDLTSLKDKTDGLLKFQLINHDNDVNSIVRVSNLTNTVDVEGKESPAFPLEDNRHQPGEALDLTKLKADPDVEVEINNVRLDETTGKYKAEVVVHNTGEAIDRNVAVVFPNLPTGVTLTNASGKDSDGNPYINLRPGINNGGLDKGQYSDPVAIIFDDPDLLRTPWQPQVLVGGENTAPVFEAIAPIEIMPGQKLEIPLVATDKNGDRVTFNFTPNGKMPTGELQGNGTLILNPSPEDIGSYTFTLIATDGIKETKQDVTVNVVADPVTTTRVSGVIQDTEKNPIANLKIELDGTTTTTAADGSFVLELPDNGT
jgi:Cadherin domain/Bacterial Ig-like domain